MKYVCQVCGYVYDDDKEAVPFASLPDDWTCPLCKAPKSAFKAEEEKKEDAAFDFGEDSDVTKVSAGQMAALCSNLARGADKQYKQEISDLYAELADYFAKITPAVDDIGVDKLAEMLSKDVENYPGARAIADENKDRGAARAIVWGEKVTRMLHSLVEQYQKEGDKMLAGTDIWLCTACGFVYIGDAPPEKCPVCKVPAWKFDKVEGR
jgi:rubrerythrin